MCLKNAFRCISVSEKYLRGQRVSVLKKKKKKQHDYFFSRDRIFNEKCSNLSIFCKKNYQKIIGLRYWQSAHKRQVHQWENKREIQHKLEITVISIENKNEVNVIKCHQVQPASISTCYFLRTIHYRWVVKPESVLVSFSVPV